MFENYAFTVAERFIRYVQIDTQSDPQSKVILPPKSKRIWAGCWLGSYGKPVWGMLK
jgi:hypothetical protein